MVWFRVDDNLAMHPKVLEAGNAAIGLWVRAGAWCAANLTDGFIPERAAHRLGSPGLCQKLITAGLFERQIDGYQFHQWDEKQLTKNDVEIRRQAERDRKASLRDLHKKHLRPVPSNTVSRRDTPRDTPVDNPCYPQADTPGLSTPCPAGTPGIPYPTQPNPLRVGLGSEPHLDNVTTVTRFVAAHCSLCDDDGYLPNNLVCDHTDHQQTNISGLAAVREAMGWTQPLMPKP
jgi:hypothetical protein